MYAHLHPYNNIGCKHSFKPQMKQRFGFNAGEYGREW